MNSLFSRGNLKNQDSKKATTGFLTNLLILLINYLNIKWSYAENLKLTPNY